jgi:hypothetical protein
MVLGNLSYKIYYYSFDTGDMMFFVFSLSVFCYSGVDVLPPTPVRHCALR